MINNTGRTITVPERPSWDNIWMEVAQTIAKRSTCLKKQIGAVIVSQENYVISTGYNGSPSGTPHCTEVGCLLDNEGRCVRTVHAELNAILRAGERTRGNKIYLTLYPCWQCSLAIVQSGIAEIIVRDIYYSENNPANAEELLRQLGVTITVLREQ